MSVTSSFGEDWRSAVALLSKRPGAEGAAVPVGTTLLCRAETDAGSGEPSDFDLSCDVRGTVGISQGRFDYRRLSLPPVVADQHGRVSPLVRNGEPGRHYFRLFYRLDPSDPGADSTRMELVVSARSDIFKDLGVGIMSDAYPKAMASIISAHEESIRVESVKLLRLR